VRIRWTEHARRDLLEIFAFIAEDRPGAARGVVAAIRKSMASTCEHPLIGRVVPELEVSNLRERIVPPYRVIYQLRREEIIVLTVIHDRRDLVRMTADVTK
jgi:addiction module RelE/StbE family toxin